MFIDREVSINSSIEDAWKVLGDDFVNAYKWASVISISVGEGEGKNGAACDVRHCELTALGWSDEKVLQYSAKDHLVSYGVEATRMPPMIKYLTSTWKLSKGDENKTLLKIGNEVQFDEATEKTMTQMLELQMGEAMSTTAHDFKHYVETGKPSAQKVKAMRELASR